MGKPRKIPWTVLRQKTGQCEICDQKMSKHDECEACNILCGSGHVESDLFQYRGYKLCSHCLQAWQKVEAFMGRPVEYDEFRKGVGTVAVLA